MKKIRPGIGARVLLAVLPLFSLSLAGEGGDAEDRAVAADVRVTCGDTTDIWVFFDSRMEREVDLPDLAGLIEGPLVFRRKDGGISPFIWLDAAKPGPESHRYVHRGYVVYLLKGVLLPPGDYTISCAVKDAEGSMTPLLCRPGEIRVMADMDTPFLDSLAKRVIAANPDPPVNSDLMGAWHRMLVDLPGDAPDLIFDFLRRSAKDPSPTAGFLRSEAVQALGKFYNKELVEEFGLPHAKIPARDIIEAILSESSSEARNSYYMILHYMEDIIEEKDHARLKEVVTYGKNSKDPEDVFGAFMAIVGNAELRNWIGEDEIVRQVLSNNRMDRLSVGFVLKYLAMKTGRPHPLPGPKNETPQPRGMP